MNKLENIILDTIMFCFMIYSFIKGDTNLLILCSTGFIFAAIPVIYDELRQKYKDEENKNIKKGE